MPKIIVTFENKVPTGVTEEEIEAWVNYRLGYCASISLDNPLRDECLGAGFVSVEFD